MKNDQTDDEHEPFACNLNALDPEGRNRHHDVTHQLQKAIQEVAELPDGYAFRLPSSSENMLLATEFVARERLCCPFFTFELVVEKSQGPFWLKLRGREGVKEFIQTEMKIK